MLSQHPSWPSRLQWRIEFETSLHFGFGYAIADLTTQMLLKQSSPQWTGPYSRRSKKEMHQFCHCFILKREKATPVLGTNRNGPLLGLTAQNSPSRFEEKDYAKDIGSVERRIPTMTHTLDWTAFDIAFLGPSRVNSKSYVPTKKIFLLGVL